MVIQLDGEKLKLRAITHICKAKKREMSPLFCFQNGN